MPKDDSPATKPRPGRRAETAEREAERRARLAAALRENLRRRKARRGSGDPGEGGRDAD